LSEEAKCIYMPDLTWPEFKEYLPKIKMAIIPVGSHEQHGPHGRFQMDGSCAREYSKLLGQRLYPYAAVAPLVPIGNSKHHMHFPGTLTLSQETLKSVLLDIAESLRFHGIRRFCFANGHGGNVPVINVVINKLRHDFNDRACFIDVPGDGARDVAQKYVKSATYGHSCEIEISGLLYLWPDAVKKEALTPGDVTPLAISRKTSPIHEALWWDENTKNGCLGDARLATAEIGKEIVDTSLSRVVPALMEFMDKDF
jgi:creatinine amidohydrolase